MRQRWYAPLLKASYGTSLFVMEQFPNVKFKVDRQTVTAKKIKRVVHFEVDGQPIVLARSEIDIAKTKPQIVRELKEGKKPMGLILQKFKVKHTRLRATSRTREFHYTGDMNAKIWERFLVEPRRAEKNKLPANE